MTPEEQLRVNRVVAVLTNQRNAALNDVANLSAALQESNEAVAAKDTIIKILQGEVARLTAANVPLPVPDPAPIESMLEK